MKPKEWEPFSEQAICFHFVWCLYWCRSEHFEQCVSVRPAASASIHNHSPSFHYRR